MFYVFSVLCLLCLCACLFICALWSPAGKGLTSWLSFVVSNCEFVTIPLVSWVRCGTWLYRFLIFAPLLTFLWMFPMIPSLNCTNGSAPSNSGAARALDKNYLKWYLLNHCSKFKIIPQNCSSWYPLPNLNKWFCSAEQKGRQSSRKKYL